MRIFSPQRRQRCILHNVGRSRCTLMLAVVLGLAVALQAPLDAAAQSDKGGTIVWAVHEGMPTFDIHYETTYWSNNLILTGAAGFRVKLKRLYAVL